MTGISSAINSANSITCPPCSGEVSYAKTSKFISFQKLIKNINTISQKVIEIGRTHKRLTNTS
jgi:hypothetical protein